MIASQVRLAQSQLERLIVEAQATAERRLQKLEGPRKVLASLGDLVRAELRVFLARAQATARRRLEAPGDERARGPAPLVF